MPAARMNAYRATVAAGPATWCSNARSPRRSSPSS